VSGFLIGSFSLALFAQGIGVALSLGWIGGAYPAWRASRMTPAEAMRAEGGASPHASRLRSGGSLLRNVLRQPTRALLTVIGVGVAIMAIVSLGALSDGFISEITDLASMGGAHLVGMEADASMDLSKIDEGIVRRISALPGVQDAEGFLTGYASLGDLPFFVVFGYHPRGRALEDFRIVEGEALAANRQIVLGRVAADNLDKGIGETVRVFDTSFRIVGIYETGVPFEDGGGMVSLRDAQSLFGQPHKISFLSIWLADPNRAGEVRDEVETRFPEVALSLTSDFAEDVTDIQAMQASTWAISLLALLVGGAGMTNTMVMSVFERTREIGVLRALGWRKGRVLRMIMRESVALSLLGGAAGFVTGAAISALLNTIPLMAGFVQTRLSLSLVLQSFATAFCLGAVGGLYPAWRATRLQPVEALRYE
jgi:ABC-type lipoprotein release transport system permease subunit